MFIRSLIEDFKARFLRGEKRTAPRGVRGRVYAKAEGEPQGQVRVAAKATATLQATVTRADGTIEHYEFPAEVIKHG